MHLEITEEGEKVLTISNEKELLCSSINCNEIEWNKLHYCEQDKKLYCRNCLITDLRDGKGCTARYNKELLTPKEHNDWKITMVKVEKHNPKHILNKELLKNDTKM